MIKATLEAPPLRPADAAGMLPRQTFDVTFKSLEDNGDFAMTAAVFGNVDKGGDVIDVGAFDNLAEFTKEGWVALSHDQRALPIALVDTASQDSQGLQVTGRFHSTPAAQECRTVFKERMAAGKTVKASIGYVTTEESFERLNGKQIRRIKKLSLYEVSFVNLPMNPLAYVHSVKSQGDPMTEPPIEAKRSVAISAANHKMLKAYGDAMDEHHTKLADQMKGFKECHKAMCKTHDEMKSFIKGFAPAAADDGGDGDDGDEEEEVEVVVEKPRRKKPEKAAEPEPKALTQEQQTLATYHDQLRRRSNAGRKIQACP